MPSSAAPSPEDLELSYRRRELAALRAVLAERDAHLANLRNRLNAFEGRYIRQVGVLYVQLDEWHERLAELKNPTTTPSADVASLPESAPVADATMRAASGPGGAPALDLKSLFREVAKRIHPDHARDALDERHRNHLMAQANAALLREDAPMLHRMLHSHDLPIEAPDSRSELTHTRALLQHLQIDLAALEAEIGAITQSEMADLQRRTAEAAQQGQDILAELAARVKGQIGIAMSRYEREIYRRQHPGKGMRTEDLLTAATPPRSR